MKHDPVSVGVESVSRSRACGDLFAVGFATPRRRRRSEELGAARSNVSLSNGGDSNRK